MREIAIQIPWRDASGRQTGLGFRALYLRSAPNVKNTVTSDRSSTSFWKRQPLGGKRTVLRIRATHGDTEMRMPEKRGETTAFWRPAAWPAILARIAPAWPADTIFRNISVPRKLRGRRRAGPSFRNL